MTSLQYYQVIEADLELMFKASTLDLRSPVEWKCLYAF